MVAKKFFKVLFMCFLGAITLDPICFLFEPFFLLNFIFYKLFSYSHSNHVEMGLTTINELIGTDNFTTLPIISESETNVCLENCELVSEECTTLVSIFSNLLSLIGYTSVITSCPLQYYKCENNINILDKLLSGYVSGQSLDDGVSYLLR